MSVIACNTDISATMLNPVMQHAAMTCFVTFHKQDSGHYSIDIEASSKFAAADIDGRLVCKSCTNLDIVKNGRADNIYKNLL